MKVGPIALMIRAAETRFGNNVAGAAEFGYAWGNVIHDEVAFVIPLGDTVSPNNTDSGISQKITENFAVIVVVKNDISARDKTGLTAYDLIHDIRAEIFSAILGYQIPGTEDLISYAGARLLNVNRANLWYQFEFVTATRIDDDDGIDVGTDALEDFNTIYTQWVLSPSANLPVGGVPVTTFSPDMTSIVDLTDDPRYGAFDRGFRAPFDVYDEKRRIT